MATDLNPYHSPSAAADNARGRSRLLYAGSLLTALAFACVFWFCMVYCVPAEQKWHSDRGAEIQTDVQWIVKMSGYLHMERYYWMFVAVVFAAGLGLIKLERNRQHNARMCVVLRTLVGLVVCIGIIATIRMAFWSWPALQRAL